MIKYLLILIAAVLVMLGIYSYTNQESKKPASKPSIPEKKVEVTETEKVLTQPKVVKVKKRVTESVTINPPKVISHEETQEVENEEEIGKGLTLESIENADVSDEEKERMLDDMAYYKSLNTEPSKPLSEEEVLTIIEEDLKNGLTQQIKEKK